WQSPTARSGQHSVARRCASGTLATGPATIIPHCSSDSFNPSATCQPSSTTSTRCPCRPDALFPVPLPKTIVGLVSCPQKPATSFEVGTNRALRGALEHGL